jgi:hypothetical protein
MRASQALLEKIQALPPERLVEVEDFVDFLAAKANALKSRPKTSTSSQIRHSRESGNPSIRKHWRRYGFPLSRE